MVLSIRKTLIDFLMFCFSLFLCLWNMNSKQVLGGSMCKLCCPPGEIKHLQQIYPLTSHVHVISSLGELSLGVLYSLAWVVNRSENFCNIYVKFNNYTEIYICNSMIDNMIASIWKDTFFTQFIAQNPVPISHQFPLTSNTTFNDKVRISLIWEVIIFVVYVFACP